MAVKSGNQNHPKKGAAIKVNPIREVSHINAIKALLTNHPRNFCLFVLGINTAFRANELLSLTVGQVSRLQIGSHLEVKQSKTKKYRIVTINEASYAAIREWLSKHPKRDIPKAALFLSQKTKGALQVPTVNHLVKSWCAKVGIIENTGSHTMRKTWGYHQRIQLNTRIPLLMEAFGHDTEAQTLDYLGIQADEIQSLYMRLVL